MIPHHAHIDVHFADAPVLPPGVCRGLGSMSRDAVSIADLCSLYHIIARPHALSPARC